MRLGQFPDVLLSNEVSFSHRGNWHSLFERRIGRSFCGRLVFEIGCFDAQFLCNIARKNPATGFVGLDWKCKPLIEAAERITASALTNVILLRAPGQDIGKIFSDAEVDEVWIFHPDPCDRDVELKNRLINEAFLIDTHATLKQRESVLAIKTDHPGYYQWMLSLLGLPEPEWFDETPANVMHPKLRRQDLMRREDLPKLSHAALARFDVAMNAPDFWNDPAAQSHTSARLFADEQTLFESRFTLKRQPIHYVELRKRDTPA